MCDCCRLTSRPACPLCDESLVLTELGWVCPDCGYIQQMPIERKIDAQTTRSVGYPAHTR